MHVAVFANNTEGLKLLLRHPSLTTLTLNHKETSFGATPLMWSVRYNRLEHLVLLAADPRVNLEIMSIGVGLEEVKR